MILKCCPTDFNWPLNSCLLRYWTPPALTARLQTDRHAGWQTLKKKWADREIGGQREVSEMKSGIRSYLAVYISLYAACCALYVNVLLQDCRFIVYRAAQSARKQVKPCSGEVGSHPCWAQDCVCLSVCVRVCAYIYVCLLTLCFPLSAWVHVERVEIITFMRSQRF